MLTWDKMKTNTISRVGMYCIKSAATKMAYRNYGWDGSLDSLISVLECLDFFLVCFFIASTF